MKDELIACQHDPAQLEKLYRSDKVAFKQAFDSLYTGPGSNQLLDFWNERLNFPKENTSVPIGWNDLVFVIIICLTAGLIAKLPAFLSWDEDFFYARNMGFIVFPALYAYFIRKNKLSAGKIAVIGGAGLLCL